MVSLAGAGGLRMGDGSKVRVGVMMGKRFSMISGDRLGDGGNTSRITDGSDGADNRNKHNIKSKLRTVT
jgi:hypothetical protein